MQVVGTNSRRHKRAMLMTTTDLNAYTEHYLARWKSILEQGMLQSQSVRSLLESCKV